jgi:osmotically-inducible protein OsmY
MIILLERRMQLQVQRSVTPRGAVSADTALRRAVLARLISDPQVSTGHLRVAAIDGAVTLSGHVASHAQRDAANAAAHRVKGVGRITDEVRIAVPASPATLDADPGPDIASRFRQRAGS